MSNTIGEQTDIEVDIATVIDTILDAIETGGGGSDLIAEIVEVDESAS